MEQYSSKVMEHFAKPHNVGEIENADPAVAAAIKARAQNYDYTALLAMLRNS